MRSSNRPSLLIVVLLLAALAIAAVTVAVGCGGDDVPENAIAKIDDTVITKANFDQVFERALRSQAANGGTAPDPPTFEKCVAAARKQQPKDSEVKDTELRKQCRQSYNDLRKQTIETLIRTVWIEQSAEESDVEVSDAEARKSLESQKAQIYPNEKDYRKFLRTSGTTEAEVLENVKHQLTEQLVTEKATEDETEVTPEDVEQYYRTHKRAYGQPERRDVLVVLASSRARALQAKQAIARGARWSQVVDRYSIDPTTKEKDGKLEKLRKGSEERAVDEAIFAARKGQLSGPIESQFGWYVFEIAKVYPATQKTLDEARDAIREKLTTERRDKALTKYNESYEKRFKEKTHCAEGFKVPICSGEPDPPEQPGFPMQ